MGLKGLGGTRLLRSLSVRLLGLGFGFSVWDL